MAATITVNTNETEYDDCSFDDSQAALPVLEWLAEKYGVRVEQVAIGQLMLHMATMATLNGIGGFDTTRPSYTPGDAYDDIRDNVTSSVLVHSVD